MVVLTDCCCQLLNCASHTSIGGEAGQRTHYWLRLDGPGTDLGRIGPARICLDVLQIGGGGIAAVVLPSLLTHSWEPRDLGFDSFFLKKKSFFGKTVYYVSTKKTGAKSFVFSYNHVKILHSTLKFLLENLIYVLH